MKSIMGIFKVIIKKLSLTLNILVRMNADGAIAISYTAADTIQKNNFEIVEAPSIPIPVNEIKRNHMPIPGSAANKQIKAITTVNGRVLVS